MRARRGNAGGGREGDGGERAIAEQPGRTPRHIPQPGLRTQQNHPKRVDFSKLQVSGGGGLIRAEPAQNPAPLGTHHLLSLPTFAVAALE